MSMLLAIHADLIDHVVRSLRIIVGTLVFSLILFISICAVIGPSTPKPVPAPTVEAGTAQVPADAKLPLLTVLSFLFAATLLPLSVVLPGIVADSWRKKLAAGKALAGAPPGDVPGLVMIFQTKTIVAAALSEGPAVFAAIAYLMEGNPIALALAAVLTVFVGLRFPARARVDHWLEGQLSRLLLERQGAIPN